MSPKNLTIAMLAVFVVGVVALTLGGKHFLQNLEQADATVSYLDLARQATQQRQFEQADAYYKQALNFAEQTADKSENLILTLGCYSDFLRMKRNPLKDVTRAQSLEARALALSRQTN